MPDLLLSGPGVCQAWPEVTLDCAPGEVRRTLFSWSAFPFLSLAVHSDQSQALTRASSTWNSQHFLGPSVAGVSGTPPPSSPPLRALRSQKQRLAGSRLGFRSVSRLEDSHPSHPAPLGPRARPSLLFSLSPSTIRTRSAGLHSLLVLDFSRGVGDGEAPPRKRPVQRRSWNLATWPHLRSPLPCPPLQYFTVSFLLVHIRTREGG